MKYRPDIGAAARNHQLSKQTVRLLDSMRTNALMRADDLREQLKRAQDLGSRARFVRSLHWAPGFFPTPPDVVARMFNLADVRAGHEVLEPEAGTGNLANEARRRGAVVQCVEIVPRMAENLRALGFAVACTDFLSMDPLHPQAGRFDRVLMNPPFENRQDEQHIRHAFTFLRPGGRLVGVCTVMTAARMSGWVRQYGRIESLPADAFKKSERSTGVHTSLVILNR